MSDFSFEQLNLDGAYIISNFYAGDLRGRFSKLFEKKIFAKAGINFKLQESFVSVSAQNVVRGMHFQINHPQTKLVSVLHGKAWDCIVDLRRDSSTYKQWTGVELSGDNHKSIYIPEGFAHGFAALEDNTIMLYQCDGAYDKKTDTGILIDDDELAIKWPVHLDNAIRSERDLHLLTIREYENIVDRI